MKEGGMEGLFGCRNFPLVFLLLVVVVKRR